MKVIYKLINKMEGSYSFIKKEDNIITPEIMVYLNNLGIKPEDLKGDVLDVGAGDGELAEFLSKNKNLKVTAIDPVPYRKGKFEVSKGDARDLSFKDESFDTVISHASVPHILGSLYSYDFPGESETQIKWAVQKSFDEIIRVLKTDGQAVLAPVGMSSNYEGQKITTEAIIKELERLKEQGHMVTKEFLKTEINPDNQKKTDYYRIIIQKGLTN